MNQTEFVDSGELKYLRFVDPKLQGIKHGFFTRLGGVSKSPFNSLNLGSGLGDLSENIIENKRRLFCSIGRSMESMFDVWQVHSSDVVFTDLPRSLSNEHQKADAIFTQNPEVTLLMRFADCVPVLIYHPGKRVVGIIHAGWKGTINKIVSKAIKLACDRYKLLPDEIIAAIGPSIGPDHYEVGSEVYKLGNDVFSESKAGVFKIIEDRIYMDLWEANRFLLIESGVNNVFLSGMCTACNTDLWFSHRAEKGLTGRFAAVISLE